MTCESEKIGNGFGFNGNLKYEILYTKVYEYEHENGVDKVLLYSIDPITNEVIEMLKTSRYVKSILLHENGYGVTIQTTFRRFGMFDFELPDFEKDIEGLLKCKISSTHDK